MARVLLRKSNALNTCHSINRRLANYSKLCFDKKMSGPIKTLDTSTNYNGNYDKADPSSFLRDKKSEVNLLRALSGFLLACRIIQVIFNACYIEQSIIANCRC